MSIRVAGPPRRPGLPAVDRALLRARARTILSQLGQARFELSIVLTDDPGIACLNAKYRGIEGSTDVLSFSLLEGEHAERRGDLLGDVVISVETAQRQARAERRSLDAELARLLIHGALHLLGHDHERPEQACAMRQEERRLWRAISS